VVLATGDGHRYSCRAIDRTNVCANVAHPDDRQPVGWARGSSKTVAVTAMCVQHASMSGRRGRARLPTER
jgi:hypothetical protein